jgi:uncharacterized protein (DUF433 family)
MVIDTLDWSGCPITERDPEKMGGVSTVRGIRMSADSVVENYEDGMTPEEISSEFNVSPEDVRTVVAYAEQARHRSAHPVR